MWAWGSLAEDRLGINQSYYSIAFHYNTDLIVNDNVIRSLCRLNSDWLKPIDPPTVILKLARAPSTVYTRTLARYVLD